MPPAGGDSSAVPSPRPTSDPARLESPADARRACPSASRNRSRCAAGDSCIGPHTVESGVLHLPATAASPLECGTPTSMEQPVSYRNLASLLVKRDPLQYWKREQARECPG